MLAFLFDLYISWRACVWIFAFIFCHFFFVGSLSDASGYWNSEARGGVPMYHLVHSLTQKLLNPRQFSCHVIDYLFDY